MVVVAQPAEPRAVNPDGVGANPTGHPNSCHIQAGPRVRARANRIRRRTRRQRARLVSPPWRARLEHRRGAYRGAASGGCSVHSSSERAVGNPDGWRVRLPLEPPSPWKALLSSTWAGFCGPPSGARLARDARSKAAPQRPPDRERRRRATSEAATAERGSGARGAAALPPARGGGPSGGRGAGLLIRGFPRERGRKGPRVARPMNEAQGERPCSCASFW